VIVPGRAGEVVVFAEEVYDAGEMVLRFCGEAPRVANFIRAQYLASSITRPFIYNTNRRHTIDANVS